jgi:hypothetical protein
LKVVDIALADKVSILNILKVDFKPHFINEQRKNNC